MSEQHAYEEASRELEKAEKYVALIGAKYIGGGGGVGEVRRVRVSMTVYHQAYDGAPNYHDIPEALKGALSAAVAAAAKPLLDEALSQLRADKRAAAQAFHAKMAEVAEQIR